MLAAPELPTGGQRTARGGLHAIRATAEHLFGSSDLAGRSVLVSDVDEAGVRDRLRPRRARACPETEVDVYSPCAVGGTLNADSIPRLACRAIADCANNRLGEPEDARRLYERDILFAPEYVVNAGGIIRLIELEDEG